MEPGALAKDDELKEFEGRCGTCAEWDHSGYFGRKFPGSTGSEQSDLLYQLRRCRATAFEFRASGLSDDTVEFHVRAEGPPWGTCRYYHRDPSLPQPGTKLDTEQAPRRLARHLQRAAQGRTKK